MVRGGEPPRRGAALPPARGQRRRGDALSPLALRVTTSRAFIRTVTTLHVAAYRASRGRVGHRSGQLRFLLLHTTGARSGRARTTPLLYLADPADPAGRTLAIVASNGGSDRHPGWLHNLRRTPEAAVTVGRERLRVRAREAGPEEHARLWALLDQVYPYRTYQARTARPIPVVLLEPADTGP